jgi:hypothetical protein
MLMLAMFPKARRPLTLIVVRPVRRLMLPLKNLALMKVRLALTLAQMKVRPIRMLMLMLPQRFHSVVPRP